MKLVLPGINTILCIKEGSISSLIIENADLLYRVIMDIRHQLDKKDGKTVLSINNEVIEIYKHIELVTDIYGINLNSKTILTKIVDALSQKAVDEFHYERTMKTISLLQNYVDDLVWDMDCDVACSNIMPKQIIKTVDLYVIDEEQELPLRILKYIELITKFIGDKLFVFVNFRSFIGEKDFALLTQTLLEHGVKVLFIENKSYPIVLHEERLTVDIDLCEF